MYKASSILSKGTDDLCCLLIFFPSITNLCFFFFVAQRRPLVYLVTSVLKPFCDGA